MNKTTDDSSDSPEPRVPEEPPVFENAVEPADAAFEPDHEAEPDIEPDAPPFHPGTERGEAPAAPPPRRGRSIVAWLALVIALGAIASSGYVAWQNRASDDDRAGNEAAIAELSSDLREAVNTLQASQREAFAERDDASRRISQRLDSLEREVDDVLRQSESVAPRLGNLEEAVSSLQGISAGVRDTWMLAEAEYYMQIANAQLQLAGNPRIAALALNFASERIRQMANPALGEVRRTLTQELQALESMEPADLEGMSFELASLAERVESLPLNQDVDVPEDEAAPVDPELSGFRRAIASMKRAFGDVVSVRRTDEELTPLLSPDAAYFLRANLALKFHAARLALLRGEQGVFEQSLDDAAGWLEEYYDVDSSAVAGALDTLSELKEESVSVTPPDISGSLRLLRQYRTLRNTESSRTDDDESRADEPSEPDL
jgi:uroporphyrin-3 C-methyltransferase